MSCEVPFPRRRSQVVRQRSAKPLFVGSIPTGASLNGQWRTGLSAFSPEHGNLATAAVTTCVALSLKICLTGHARSSLDFLQWLGALSGSYGEEPSCCGAWPSRGQERWPGASREADARATQGDCAQGCSGALEGLASPPAAGCVTGSTPKAVQGCHGHLMFFSRIPLLICLSGARPQSAQPM